jgi:hypothetical protein
VALSVAAVGTPADPAQRLAAARKARYAGTAQPTRPVGMKPALNVAQAMGAVGQSPTGARPMAPTTGAAQGGYGGARPIGFSPTGGRPMAPTTGAYGGYGGQQGSFGAQQGGYSGNQQGNFGAQQGGGYGGQQGGGQYPGSTPWWQQAAQGPQSQANYGSSQFNYGGGYAPSGYSAQGPYSQSGQGYGQSSMPSYQAPSFQNTAYPQLAQTNYQRQMYNNMPSEYARQYQFENSANALGLMQGVSAGTIFPGYGTAWGPGVTGPGSYVTGGSHTNWDALNQGGAQQAPQYGGQSKQPSAGRRPMRLSDGTTIWV